MMIMPFNFEGDEVAEVMEAVMRHIEGIAAQPLTDGNREKLRSLGWFVDEMGPVIERGKLEEYREEKARMN